MPRTSVWTAIAETLRADIAAARYPVGARLPTEAALAARFGHNRHTIRRALAALQGEGLVVSRQGAGVFVRGRPLDYRIGLRTRFSQNLADVGQTPAREILRLETLPAGAAEAAALEIPPAALVHTLETVGRADGQPTTLGHSVFPAARFPGLPDALRATGSVTQALALEGLPDYTRASTRLSAERANTLQARHLAIAEGAPLLLAVSLNIDPAGRPVEHGRTWFAGDRVHLIVEPAASRAD